jgi:HAD superfamily hydrolase (TIGR01490 family)
MTRWAVFDVDGTLVPRASMEREFIRYLMAIRLLPFQNVVLYLRTWVLDIVRCGWEEATRVNKSYLHGLRASDVDAYAEACFRERIVPGIVHAGSERVDALRHDGFKIMIVSGAPSFLVHRLDRIFHPDFTVATTLETRDGRFTGNITGLHPFGTRKRAILKNLQVDLDIDFAASVVFANHHSDVHHMRLFGRAVAVNPDARLLRTASKLGWEVTTWP